MLLNNTTSINKLLGRFTKTASFPLMPIEALHPEGLAALGIDTADQHGNMGADIAKLRQAEEALNAPRHGNMGADIAKLRQAEYLESIKPGGENFEAHQKALMEADKAEGFGKIKNGLKAGLQSAWDDVSGAGKTVRDGMKTLFSGDWITDDKAVEEELSRRSEELANMPLEERQKVMQEIGKKHSIIGKLENIPAIPKQYESFYDDTAQVEEPLKPSRAETPAIPHDKGNSYTGRDIIGVTPAPKASGNMGADIAGLRRAEQAIGAEGRSASELLKALGIGGAGAVGAYGMRKAYKASKARKAAKEAHLERLLRSIR